MGSAGSWRALLRCPELLLLLVGREDWGQLPLVVKGLDGTCAQGEVG